MTPEIPSEVQIESFMQGKFQLHQHFVSHINKTEMQACTLQKSSLQNINYLQVAVTQEAVLACAPIITFNYSSDGVTKGEEKLHLQNL